MNQYQPSRERGDFEIANINLIKLAQDIKNAEHFLGKIAKRIDLAVAETMAFKLRGDLKKMEKFTLDVPKMGYILLSKYEPHKGNDFFGKAIYRTQLNASLNIKNCLYTHAEILSGGPHSVRINPPRSNWIDITKYYSGKYIKIVKLNNDIYQGYDNKYRYKINCFYNSLNNLRYDGRGILAFVSRWFHHSKRKYFCSEGVCWAIQKIYPGFFGGGAANKCYPASILADPGIELVWEGRLP